MTLIKTLSGFKRTSAAILSGAAVTYSVRQNGTGGATGETWQYTAPAGKKISNVVMDYYNDGWLLTYDAKDRSLRLVVPHNFIWYPYWGDWVDYTASIIEATDTHLKFGPYTTPPGHNLYRAPNNRTVAVISLY